jgi:nucleotide-binding universal stress UspA family protein
MSDPAANVEIKPIKRILYATDLSDKALQAMTYAVSLADAYHAQLVILHVIDKIPEFVDRWVEGYITSEEWAEIKQQHVDEAQKTMVQEDEALHKILDKSRQRLRPLENAAHDETVVKKGNPVLAIIETAKEKECDLIVMGSHGGHALMDAMIGSTTHRVLHRSDVPVMVVPHSL